MDGESAAEKKQVARVQALFVKHASQIRGFIISMMPGASETDDILQETFLTVTAKAKNFELGTNFVAWAMTIARFKVLEHFRQGKKSELLLGDEILELLVEDAPNNLADDAQIRALKACLQRLSPQVQTMLGQRYAEGWKPERIATEAGWGANSVYVALSRARTALRECIVKQVKGGLA